MKKTYKVLLTIIAVIAGIVLIMFLLNYFAEEKAENKLKNYLSSYKEINFNLYSSKLSVTEPVFTYKGSKIKADKIKLKDFQYYQYFTNGKIIFEKLLVQNLMISYAETKTDSSQQQSSFSKNILINEVKVVDGMLSSSAEKGKGKDLFFKFEKLKMQDFSVDSASVVNAIPFNYKEYLLLGDTLNVALGTGHSLAVGDLRLENGDVLLKDLSINQKFTPAEFQQQIPYEKDRYVLNIDEVKLNSLEVHTVNDSLKFTNPLMTIKNADLQVYRGKQLPDNPEVKTLYSEKLRSLPFKIDFENIKIENSRIVYLENYAGAERPAEINFQGINGSIKNLSNLNVGQKESPNTEVDASAMFMGASNLNFHWQFNPSSLDEGFSVSGNFGEMDISQMNQYLQPARNVKVNGTLEKLDFDIYGNQNVATGNMIIKYHDLEINKMEADEQDEKELFSFFANLVVDQKVMTEEENITDIKVTREKTKSFWNYLWTFLREGIREAVL